MLLIQSLTGWDTLRHNSFNIEEDTSIVLKWYFDIFPIFSVGEGVEFTAVRFLGGMEAVKFH